jgi:hypothetical protein
MLEVDPMQIKEMIRIAANVPVVPFWAQLVSGIVMAGAKVLPEDLWDSVSKKLETEHDDLEDLKVDGFTIENNHARSEEHEIWIIGVIERFAEENPNKTIWAIPVDELLCLAEDDDTAYDFVSITRMFFAGTEDELRAAISAWVGA